MSVPVSLRLASQGDRPARRRPAVRAPATIGRRVDRLLGRLLAWAEAIRTGWARRVAWGLALGPPLIATWMSLALLDAFHEPEVALHDAELRSAVAAAGYHRELHARLEELPASGTRAWPVTIPADMESWLMDRGRRSGLALATGTSVALRTDFPTRDLAPVPFWEMKTHLEGMGTLDGLVSFLDQVVEDRRAVHLPSVVLRQVAPAGSGPAGHPQVRFSLDLVAFGSRERLEK